MNILDLVNEYLRMRNLRPDTERTYRQRARSLADRIGLHELDALTVDNALAYRDSCINDGCSMVTWNTNRRHLIALFTFAIKQGWATKCPFTPVAVGREFVRPKLVSTDDFRLAMEAIGERDGRFEPHGFWRLALLTLALTAMRRAQLVGLAWTDIDLSTRPRILLRGETSKTAREYEAPVCDQLRQLLTQFRLISRTLWTGSEASFATSQVFNIDLHQKQAQMQRSLKTDDVSGFFRRLGRDSGARISAHRLRHRAATVLIRDGLDIRNVQELLGHTSIHTTMRYLWPDLSRTTHAINRHVETELSGFAGLFKL
jgi:integrase